MKNPLNDKEFLKQLDSHKHKTVYAKITSLDQNEYPRESIEGRVSGGSINIDGGSTLARTCSLTLVALEEENLVPAAADQKVPITDVYWAFENRFKLEIGLENDINPDYPNIIWFKQGIYIINSFSKSYNTNSLNISISGRDKMCLLNGTVSGALASSVDFGTEEIIDDNGDITIKKVPIYTIIQKGLLTYANERLNNIIINDLDDNAWELWEYRGRDPMYMIYQNGKVINIVLDGEAQVSTTDTNTKIALKNIPQYWSFNTLDKDYNKGATEIIYGSASAYVAKCEYGTVVGYHPTELIYPSDLILSAGEPFTAALDKIVSMLGEFEYFYDVDGRFIFQKKKTYLQELFSPINGDIIEPSMIITPYSYEFDDLESFTAIADSPKVDNIKNDFTVWGTRKGVKEDLPIHVRYAIDKKPTLYTTPWQNERYLKLYDLYFLDYTYIETPRNNDRDELLKYIQSNDIYAWANDNNNIGFYAKINTLADYDKNANSAFYKIKTFTKYEDLAESFAAAERSPINWHKIIFQKQDNGDYKSLDTTNFKNVDLYYQKKDPISLIWQSLTVSNESGEKRDTLAFQEDVLCTNLEKIYIKDTREIFSSTEYDWRELIYQMALDFYEFRERIDFFKQIEAKNPTFINGRTGYEQYYQDIQGFWRELYNPNPENKKRNDYYHSGDDKYWNKNIHFNPASLNFWFDFLDVGGNKGLAKYSVPKIGTRSKVENKNTIKSIYYESTPEVQFIIIGKDAQIAGTSYSPIQIQSNINQMFANSGQGLSGISRINELINNHTIFNEGLTLTSVPIFYLEPNTRIYVKDKGDYIINRISYSLNYNSTMSLTCTKIAEQII